MRNLLKHVAEVDGENRYTLYAIDAAHPFYSSLRGSPNITVRSMRTRNPVIRVPVELGLRTLFDDLDVLHVQYVAPPWFRGRLVVTIHDLAFLHVPDSFKRLEALRLRILVPRNARRADCVITDSEFSKRELIERYGIHPERVSVIRIGVDTREEPRDVTTVLRRHGIRRPFILTVGRLDRRKNLARVLDGFSLARSRRALPHQLVIVGKDDSFANQLPARVRLAGLQEVVVRTGFLPDEDLAAVLRAADALVYVSLFEGFGLPMIEAMAVGCPVVASGSSCIPEIAGDAALLVDPLSVDAIAAGIERILSDAELRSELVRRGLARATLFSSRQSAERTVQLYRRLQRESL